MAHPTIKTTIPVRPLSHLTIRNDTIKLICHNHTKSSKELHSRNSMVFKVLYTGTYSNNYCYDQYTLSLICIIFIVYSPTKVKHHLTCFNNIFSNNELISNRFAVFVTCTHILTYLWNRLLIDFNYVYMTGCVKCHVYFSTFVFANEADFFFV